MSCEVESKVESDESRSKGDQKGKAELNEVGGKAELEHGDAGMEEKRC